MAISLLSLPREQVSSREQLRLSAIAHVPAPSFKASSPTKGNVNCTYSPWGFLAIRLDLFAH
jgi:hypothetical protein